MKNIILTLTMLLGFSPFSHATNNSPEIFTGEWHGRGVYVREGVESFCSEFHMGFSASAVGMNFFDGMRKCDFHEEKFDPVQLSYQDGSFYFYGQKVGELNGNIMTLGFEAPDPKGGIRVWRMTMRVEGSRITYDESRTMKGDTEPLITFAGIMLRKNSFSDFAMTEMPSQPTLAEHPGSNVYEYGLKADRIQINGRSVDVYLPTNLKNGSKVPVIVFGHGQAIDLAGYQLSFEHFAKKGVAVIFPQYDNGFFDRDWNRMSTDFNSLTAETLKKYADTIDASKVVYAGHSKGGYIAVSAAGAPNVNLVSPKSIVLIEPAGSVESYVKNINSQIPVTITWSDADTVTKEDLIRGIYNNLPVAHKQYIKVLSYTQTSPALQADHFFVLSKAYFFGGKAA